MVRAADELDRKRQPVQTFADLGHRRTILCIVREGMAQARSPVDEPGKRLLGPRPMAPASSPSPLTGAAVPGLRREHRHVRSIGQHGVYKTGDGPE